MADWKDCGFCDSPAEHVAHEQIDRLNNRIALLDNERTELLGKLHLCETKLAGQEAITKGYVDRLEACEAALRSFDVGRESSYWVGEEARNRRARLDDWHKVADERAAEIIRLSGRLDAIRRYIMGCEDRDIPPWNHDNAIERCSGLENLFLTDFQSPIVVERTTSRACAPP